MKEFKTWGDFAKSYDLVLFNQAPNLVSRDNKSYDEGVIYEWQDQHLNNCEYEQASRDIEALEGSDKPEDIKKRQDIIDEFGEYPECQCEPYQWYAIAVSDDEAEWLNKNYSLDIFYSETLDLHILPVYHFGTAWDYVNLNKVN